MTDGIPVDERRAKVTELAQLLPEVEASSATGQHTAYSVRGKKFAYFLVNHHGDGRIVVSCKVGMEMRDGLVAAEPHRFFVPAYVGPRGWVALDLDAAPFGWEEVAGLLRRGYTLTAPKTLAARVG